MISKKHCRYSVESKQASLRVSLGMALGGFPLHSGRKVVLNSQASSLESALIAL